MQADNLTLHNKERHILEMVATLLYSNLRVYKIKMATVTVHVDERRESWQSVN